MRTPKKQNSMDGVANSPASARTSRRATDEDTSKALEAVLERNLLLASRRGANEKDWEPQFSKYVLLQQDYLLQTAWRITGCYHAAQDAVQDAFIALHTQLFDKGFEGNITAWLVKVVANNALQHVRRKKNRKVASLESCVGELAIDPVGYPLEEQEAIIEAWKRVSQLPGQQQRVLVHRLIDGWDYGRIATALHVSPVTAKRCFYKALKSARAR